MSGPPQKFRVTLRSMSSFFKMRNCCSLLEKLTIMFDAQRTFLLALSKWSLLRLSSLIMAITSPLPLLYDWHWHEFENLYPVLKPCGKNWPSDVLKISTSFPFRFSLYRVTYPLFCGFSTKGSYRPPKTRIYVSFRGQTMGNLPRKIWESGLSASTTYHSLPKTPLSK